MKHYRDEKDGATFTNQDQAFHYIPWTDVVEL